MPASGGSPPLGEVYDQPCRLASLSRLPENANRPPHLYHNQDVPCTCVKTRALSRGNLPAPGVMSQFRSHKDGGIDMKGQMREFKSSERRRRCIVPAVVALVLGALVFGGSGLDSSLAAGDVDRPGLPDRSMIRGLTMDDLPADLNLTAAQRTRMEKVLNDLRLERRDLARAHRDRFEKRRGGPDGWAGRPECRIGRQDGRRGVWRQPAARGQGWERRDGRPDRMGPRGSAVPGRRGGQPGDFAPPMTRFLDSASEILDANQFAALARHLDARRDQQRDEPRGGRRDLRQVGRADVGRRLDRQAGTIIRILNLDDQQADAVRKVYEASVAKRQAVWDQVAAGSLPREEALSSIREIDATDAERVRGSLTEDQRIRFDAIRELRPDGPGWKGAGAPGLRSGRPGAGPGDADQPQRRSGRRGLRR